MFQKEIMGAEEIVSHRRGILDGPGGGSRWDGFGGAGIRLAEDTELMKSSWHIIKILYMSATVPIQ